MDQDIIETATEKTIGLVSHLIKDEGNWKRPRHEWFPDSWKNQVGKPEGLCDYRMMNFLTWARGHLSQKSASALIVTLRENNEEGAREILRSAGCPLKDSVTSA